MSPDEAIVFISLAVLLMVLVVLLRQYRRRPSGRSLNQNDVKIWSKSDRWSHWR